MKMIAMYKIYLTNQIELVRASYLHRLLKNNCNKIYSQNKEININSKILNLTKLNYKNQFSINYELYLLKTKSLVIDR